MTLYVLTEPQMEAVHAAWNAGMTGFDDDRWLAVEVALATSIPAGRGAVEIDLDGEAEEDLRSGVAAGVEAIGEGNPGYAAMSEALAGVARIFEAPAPGFGR